MTQAVPSSWLNAVNGNWTTANNWTPGTVPNDTAAFEYDVTIGGSATSGTAAFTVTSSAAETIGFLTINANATLDISSAVFTINSTLNSFSNAYNLGVIEVAAGAELLFGAAGSPSSDQAGFWNTGVFDLNGKLAIAAPWLGLYGSTGGFTMSGGSIIGANTGGTAKLQNNNQTIAGSGSIGTGSSLSLNNQKLATINANATAALTINTGTNQIENAGTIETTGVGGLTIESSMQLDGVLAATGKGALTIAGAEISGGGDLNISAVGSLVLNQGQINSGEINITKGGVLTTTAGNTTGVSTNNTLVGDALTTGDIQNAGSIVVANDSTLNLNATFYGAGAIDLEGTSGPTKLEIFGTGSTLDETGAIILSDSAENSIVSNGAGVQLTENSAKIEGAGTIGDTWLRFVTNPGTLVDADDSVALTIIGDTAAVTAGSESSNYFDGIVETTGAGGLTIEGGALGNANYLKANGTGALTLNDVQINNGGGIVETLGSGSIVLLGNSQIYSQAYVSINKTGSLTTSVGDTSDAILNTVLNAGKINVVAGSTLGVDGHWTNTGSVNLEGTSAATIDIHAASRWELIGAGKILLQGADSSILSSGAGTLLDNKSNTLSGSGVIGDANMTVDNDLGGTIIATGTKGLTLDSTAYNSSTSTTYLYNAGTIELKSKGGLTLEQAIYDPGEMIANTGGNIVADAAVYGDGTTTINGTGSVQFDGVCQNDVYFASGAKGKLITEDSTQFYSNIWGFGAGDTIDLGDFAYVASKTKINNSLSGFGVENGGLVLTNGTTNSSPLYFEGNYTAANLTAEHLAWRFSSDGHEIGATGQDGTLVKLVATG